MVVCCSWSRAELASPCHSTSCRASCQTPAICRTKRFLSLPTLPSVSPVKCCLEIPLSSVTRRCINWSSWTSRQAATSLDSHSLDMYVFHVNLCHVRVHCLQCFDTVCWASGIASGLQKLSDEVLVWLSVWSEVQIVFMWSSWCHCHPKTVSSLASFISRLVLPFWCQLTQVVIEKRPLNGYSSSSSLCSQWPCILGHRFTHRCIVECLWWMALDQLHKSLLAVIGRLYCLLCEAVVWLCLINHAWIIRMTDG